MGQCSPSVASPQVAEIHSTTTTIEQRSDKVDCQPSNKPPSPSQNLSASSQVLETSARVPNPAVTPRGSNLLNVQRLDNRKKGVSGPYSDPLQNEMEKLGELKNNILKFHEVVVSLCFNLHCLLIEVSLSPLVNMVFGSFFCRS